jgi:hypothetical protein
MYCKHKTKKLQFGSEIFWKTATEHTNTLEQSPSYEVKICLDKFRLLQNPLVHHIVLKSLTLTPIPFNTLSHYSFKIHFNITHTHIYAYPFHVACFPQVL